MRRSIQNNAILLARWAAPALILAVLAAGCAQKQEIPVEQVVLNEKIRQVEQDLRIMTREIERFRAQKGRYPVSAEGRLAYNFHVTRDDQFGAIPTFRVHAGESDRLITLTSPVPYIVRYNEDPFAPDMRVTYAYFASEEKFKENGWLLWSTGPDGDYDITEPHRFYTAHYPAELNEKLIQLTYDPTNGLFSDGDVWSARKIR